MTKPSRLVRTICDEGVWINLLDDGTLLSEHVEKEEAIRVGRESAEKRRAEHVIHNPDGIVAGRKDFGDDERSPIADERPRRPR